MTDHRDVTTRHDAERGLASLWLLALLPVMLLMGSLGLNVFRGYAEWRVIAERAESAARAGANGIDVEEFERAGVVQLDPDEADRLAIANLQRQDPNRHITFSAVSSDTATVAVEIRGSVPFTVLGIVTVTDIEITATAEAEPRIQR